MIYSKQYFPKINPPNQEPQHVCLHNICTKFTLQNRRKSIERAINKSKGSRNQKKVLENRYDTIRYAMFVWASSLFMALFFVFYGFALVHWISGAGRGRKVGYLLPLNCMPHARNRHKYTPPYPLLLFRLKHFQQVHQFEAHHFWEPPDAAGIPIPLSLSLCFHLKGICAILSFFMTLTRQKCAKGV